jgi:hypothetical protein
MLAEHNHTSFGVRPGDHYMPLQRSILVRMSCFAIGFLLLDITVPSGPFHNCYGFPTEAPLAPCGLIGIDIPDLYEGPEKATRGGVNWSQ